MSVGLLCIGNLIDRFSGKDAVAFYTNDGLLTNHYSLFAPVAARIWSPLFGFSTLNEMRMPSCGP